MKKYISIISIILLITACGVKRPVVYPGNGLESDGRAQADIDIADCQRLADEYVYSNPEPGVVEDLTNDGDTGEIVSKIARIIRQTMGTGVSADTAIVTASELFQGLLTATEQKSVHQSFMAKCLQGKEYEIVGWQ